MVKIIAVVSVSNDECSINNKGWFDDGNNRQIAQDYADNIEKELGCKMLVRIIEVEKW